MYFFVAKLLSIAVMTYSYVYHFYVMTHTAVSMQPQHVHKARDPTVVWCLFS